MFIIICCSCIKGYGQFSVGSNVKTRNISTQQIFQFEPNSIVPNSIILENVDSSYYTINYQSSTIFWKKKIASDSVKIIYRVFSFDFNKVHTRYNYDSIKNNFLTSQPIAFNNNRYIENPSKLLDFGNINFGGSFGRNLSFGNNQNAVFNSQLNLQMSGFIGDSIEIAAAITDNNIPIQPDGTTQQLNEFDRILLQFKKRNWELSLGDIDIKQNQNYFLNFYKRLQGVSYINEKKVGNIVKNKFLFTGAIAKGKFTRNVFNGLEGNQGPYRLQGANAEIYFIVLAGTERVFIDGELLQRGEDQDYVINYNTAEITFTPKRMITKDRRIQIEFEYAERSYLNSMLYVSNETQINKKLKLNIAAYSNADAKTSSINQQLDNQQKQFLVGLGDSVQNAFYIHENIDSFSTTKILYAKRVHPSNNSDSIYVYSTNKDSAKYNLVFAEVGVNKGNYIPYFNGINGKVYQWVAALNGIAQGNYEPAQFLITPKKQQLITVGTEYRFNANTFLKADVALSNYDVNAFSSLHKSDNKGYAGKLIVEQKKQLNKNLQLNSLISYEWVEQNFKPLERLRTVEFSRDWGLPIVNTLATEHLPKLSFELKDKKDNSIQYLAEGYFRSNNYKAVRQTFLLNQNIKDWIIKSNISYTNNNTTETNGYFFKPSIEFSRTLKKLKNYSIGSSYSLENNQQKITINDSLTPLSFSFETITAFIKSNMLKANKWGFNFFTRNDKVPQQKEMIRTDKSYNYNVFAELLENQNHQLRLNLTYRELFIKNALLTTLKPDNSLVGRVEYNINEWKGFVVGYVLYELGAGQEQRRDFSYVEVPAGRGQFAWNDYNGDGITQLNEFEIALFPDQAKYIRIFTPTNQFIKANYTQFNYSLNISPRNIANTIKNKRVRDFVSRINLQSSFQANKKIISDGSIYFNPFESNVNDTSIINLTNTFSNTISFNRSSSNWGLDISNIQNYNKSLLTYGLETRHLKDWNVKARMNIKREFTLELNQKWTTNELTTPQFNNRNYSLTNKSFEPKLIYTHLTKFRVQASYLIVQKENNPKFGTEESTNHSLNFETKYNSVQNNSLLAKFTYSQLNYNGAPNTTISYIMLEGLLPGKNYLWTIEYTKRLNNNFEISFNYEGRKPGDSKVINIGRASIRAIL